MRVIRVDNMDREGPGFDDKIIADDLPVEEASKMAHELNAKENSERSPYYYRVVPEGYKLKVFEP